MEQNRSAILDEGLTQRWDVDWKQHQIFSLMEMPQFPPRAADKDGKLSQRSLLHQNDMDAWARAGS